MGAQRTESIEEAAQRLGLSTDAVRKRVRRGTIPAIKEAGRLRILGTDDLPPMPTGSPLEAASGVPPPESGTPLARHVPATVQDTAALVAALQDQIAQLKGQLAEAANENAELRRLVSQEQA